MCNVSKGAGEEGTSNSYTIVFGYFGSVSPQTLYFKPLKTQPTPQDYMNYGLGEYRVYFIGIIADNNKSVLLSANMVLSGRPQHQVPSRPAPHQSYRTSYDMETPAVSLQYPPNGPAPTNAGIQYSCPQRSPVSYATGLIPSPSIGRFSQRPSRPPTHYARMAQLGAQSGIAFLVTGPSTHDISEIDDVQELISLFAAPPAAESPLPNQNLPFRQQ